MNTNTLTETFFERLDEYNKVLEEQAKDLNKAFADEMTHNFLNKQEILAKIVESEESILLSIAIPKSVDLNKRLIGNTLILLQEHGLIRKFAISRNSVLCNGNTSNNSYKTHEFIVKQECVNMINHAVARVLFLHEDVKTFKSSVLNYDSNDTIVRHIGYNVPGFRNQKVINEEINKNNLFETIVKELEL